MTTFYPPGVLRWRVKEILDAHGQTVYVLAQKLQGKVNRNTLYQISQNKTRRVDLETLEALSNTLTEMTGKAISVSDLFEVAPDQLHHD